MGNNGQRLFCLNCGQDNGFIVNYRETRVYAVEAYCDEEGYESDEIDSHFKHTYDQTLHEYECDNCNRPVEFLDDDFIEQAYFKHQDDNGNWSEDELEEKYWNKKAYKEYVEAQI